MSEKLAGIVERLNAVLEPRMVLARQAANQRAVTPGEFDGEIADQIEFGAVTVPLSLLISIRAFASSINEGLETEKLAKLIYIGQGGTEGAWRVEGGGPTVLGMNYPLHNRVVRARAAAQAIRSSLLKEKGLALISGGGG